MTTSRHDLYRTRKRAIRNTSVLCIAAAASVLSIASCRRSVDERLSLTIEQLEEQQRANVAKPLHDVQHSLVILRSASPDSLDVPRITSCRLLRDLDDRNGIAINLVVYWIEANPKVTGIRLTWKRKRIDCVLPAGNREANVQDASQGVLFSGSWHFPNDDGRVPELIRQEGMPDVALLCGSTVVSEAVSVEDISSPDGGEEQRSPRPEEESQRLKKDGASPKETSRKDDQ